VPVLLDLKPSGGHYMEHFHQAGGLPRLLSELRDVLALDAPTVTGAPLSAALDAAEDVPGQTIIRPRAAPLKETGAMAVLRGNLCPGGAIIKHAAAAKHLLVHEGPALVFEGLADLADRIDDPALEVTADHVLVMRNAGPKGAPGMPEAGGLPIPRKLAQAGVKDMVRISDARMSGTAYGAVVLHVAPEAAIGGPLALVQTGDRIRLDVPARRLDLLVDEATLATRRAAWVPPKPHATRGYGKLFEDHVMQAPQGCDFDFLVEPDTDQ
jgi:dihydroxy-acid dehydratase